MFSGVIFLGEPLNAGIFHRLSSHIFRRRQVTKAAPLDSSSGKASDVKGDTDVEAAGAVEAADSGETSGDHIFAEDSSEKI